MRKFFDASQTSLAIAVLALAIMAGSSARAATPQTISYQGRVLVANAPFTGTGKFRFALLDGSTIVWNSDSGVSAAAPNNNIDIAVNNGLYSVLIGNTTNTAANPYTMAALPASVFANNNPLSLRVFFGDAAGTVQALSPDQKIAAVGYAMTAASVSGGTGTFAGTVGNIVAISNSGTGGSNALSVQNTDPANGGDAIFASNVGVSPTIQSINSGGGYAIVGSNSGTGGAGYFSITNPGSTAAALELTSSSSGPVLNVTDNGNSGQPAVLVSSVNRVPIISAASGAGVAAIVGRSNSGALFVGQGAGGTEKCRINNDGSIMCGKITASSDNVPLDVNANTAAAADLAYFRKQGVLVAAIGPTGLYGNPSDKNMKCDFASVNTASYLDKISSIPITTWRYKIEQPGVHHVGPMAQDFFKTFVLGTDERFMNAIDCNGVAMAGIQELHKLSQAKDIIISLQQQKIDALNDRLEKLEKLVEKLTGAKAGE